MIPERLVRTVPSVTSAEVERWWGKACRVHSEWSHITLRDPLDPAHFPISSPHWDRCQSGAQRAGLIRLEAIHTLGGFYIDSDFEVYRPFDPLLGASFVAGWEDANTVPDFLFGSDAGNPLLLELLDAAIGCLDEGPWASGPGVFTRILPGRRDVLLLPPGSFAPYHYSERHRKTENHKDAQPWAFGAHHWEASWLK